MVHCQRSHFGLLTVLVCAASIFTAAGTLPAWGQLRPEDGPPGAEGRSSDVADVLRLDFGVGLGFQRPESWGLLNASVENDRDEARPLRVIVHYDHQANRQFVRPLWVPAQSVRRATLPAHLGRLEGTDATAQVILTEEAVERQLARANAFVRVRQDQLPYLLIAENAMDGPEIPVAELLKQVRQQARLPRLVPVVKPGDVMSLRAGWDGVALTAISAPTPDLHPEQRRALRQWVNAGGTLVVWADLVENQPLTNLLSEFGLAVSVVDRLSLASVRFAPADGASAEVSQVDLEEPAAMTRLVTPDLQPLLQVDDWPALLQTGYGDGQVVVVTVGARAWMADAAEPALDVLRAQLPTVVEQQSGAAARQMVTGPAAQQFVSGLVGYEVTGVAVLAAGFAAVLLVLLAGGWFFHRQGRLERLAPMGMAAAALVGALFVGLGQWRAADAPALHAQLQLISAQPGAPAVHVEALAGLYDPGSSTVDLAASAGGLAWPLASEEGGFQTVRWVMEDVDHWSLRGLPMPGATVRPVHLQNDVVLPSPPDANLRLTAAGLEANSNIAGQIILDDLLILTPQTAIKPEAASAGEAVWRAGSRQVLPPGQLLPQGFISRSQQERADVLQALLDRQGVTEARLVGWSDGLDLGLSTEPSLPSRSEALWQLPLDIEPVEPGQAVRVPWPLVQMAPRQDLARDLGLPALIVYTPRDAQWSEMFGPTAYVASFTPPPAVAAGGAFDVEEATIYLDLEATGWAVDVFVLDEQRRRHDLASRFSPQDEMIVTVPQEYLHASADGRMLIGFQVRSAQDAQPSQLRASQQWQVNYFGLEMAGSARAAEASEAHSAPMQIE